MRLFVRSFARPQLRPRPHVRSFVGTADSVPAATLIKNEQFCLGIFYLLNSLSPRQG